MSTLSDKPTRTVVTRSNPAKPTATFYLPQKTAPETAPAAADTVSTTDSAPAAPHRHPVPITLHSALLGDDIDLRPNFAEPRRRDTATTISPSLADTIDDMQHAWEKEHREQIRAAGLAVGPSTFREMLLRIGLKHLEAETDALGMLPLDQRRRGGTGVARR